MKNKNLLYYKIGLEALGAFVLILFVFVLSQANGTKQDQQTATKANSIATQLESYINNKQKIPASLSDAGITNVPSTISYQKLSSTSYKFCVTYKASSSDFDPGSITTNLVENTGSNTGIEDYPGSSDTGSSLTIGTNYHKGQNCQTIHDQNLIGPTGGNVLLGGVASSSTGAYNYASAVNQAEEESCAPSQPSYATYLYQVVKAITPTSITVVTKSGAANTVAVNSSTVLVYNSHCQVISYSSIKVGDGVSVHINYAKQVSSIDDSSQ